jgi:hypothetical protein
MSDDNDNDAEENKDVEVDHDDMSKDEDLDDEEVPSFMPVDVDSDNDTYDPNPIESDDESLEGEDEQLVYDTQSSSAKAIAEVSSIARQLLVVAHAAIETIRQIQTSNNTRVATLPKIKETAASSF